MVSIVAGIQDLVTPVLLSRVSAQTGESESAVSKGFAAVLPAILGTLARRSDDSAFMSRLGNMISMAPADTDAIARAAFTAADAPAATPAGLPPLMTALFGDTLSGIVESVSRFAGIRTTSASSLFSVATPLVLGYLGTTMRTHRLDIGALAGQLKDQRQTLASALPAGITAPAVLAPLAAVGHRFPQGWLWVGAALALILGGLVYWSARGPVRLQVQPGETVGTTGTLPGVRTRVLPGDVSVQVAAGGMEDRLITSLRSPGGTIGPASFAFDRIRFDTNSAVLTGESHRQIATVADVLMAYPEAMVGISGHTDDVGSEPVNLNLSRARARAVADALVSSGVPSGRIHTEGYGSSKPVADNSTEEGRALNRRVVLEIER